MKNVVYYENYHQELEAVFSECEKNIKKAIHDYERDVSGALDILKKDCIKRTAAA